MVIPREYTVREWKVWENEEGPIRDVHGNYKGSVVFQEDGAEPIDATFKNQPNPGDKKFGVVDLYQTKARKTRKGFKSAQKPMQDNQVGLEPMGQVAPQKKEWQPRGDNTQESIARSVALKAAVDMFAGKGAAAIGDVRYIRNEFLAWLQGSSESTDPKATQTTGPTTTATSSASTSSVEEQQAQREAERDAERLRSIAHEDEVYPADEPINLSDIPF